ICCGLGISTEGTKATLIQKIRWFSYERAEKQKKMSYEDTVSICSEYPTEENEILPSRIDTQVEEGQSSQHQMMEDTYEIPRKSNKHRYQNDDDNEGPGALEHKMLLEFKKLETAILGFNDRLNSVFAQIQDTHQR
ncbi:24179_t:CDS:2, partial [Racocetra persica]